MRDGGSHRHQIVDEHHLLCAQDIPQRGSGEAHAVVGQPHFVRQHGTGHSEAGALDLGASKCFQGGCGQFLAGLQLRHVESGPLHAMRPVEEAHAGMGAAHVSGQIHPPLPP